jgi:hypothetical protein
MMAMLFGSFRTLAAILTQAEYDTLRATLAYYAALEKEAGGSRLNDMLTTLSIPGDISGRGGGLDLSSPDVVAMLTELSVVPGLENVAVKVAEYVAEHADDPTELGVLQSLLAATLQRGKLQSTLRNEQPEPEPEPEPEPDEPDEPEPEPNEPDEPEPEPNEPDEPEEHPLPEPE